MDEVIRSTKVEAADGSTEFLAAAMPGWLADLSWRLPCSDALAMSCRHAADDLWFWQAVAILRGKR
jgi:hypothetical protein